MQSGRVKRYWKIPEKGEQHLDDAESIDVEIYTLKELCDMIYAEKMIVALKQCMADNRDIKLHEDL